MGGNDKEEKLVWTSDLRLKKLREVNNVEKEKKKVLSQKNLHLQRKTMQSSLEINPTQEMIWETVLTKREQKRE